MTTLELMIEAADRQYSTLKACLAVAEFTSDKEALRERLAHQAGVISGLRQARFAELAGAL